MESIEKLRHSLAHILAYAVKEIYPNVKLGMGPGIENGFYYDFQFGKPISPEDLVKIESKMKEILQKEIKFKKILVSKQSAKKLFKDQPYKLELIKGLPGAKVSVFESGEFTDLCKGPHIKSTKELNIDSFRLTRIAGAYWKGSEKNKMLTRIYGLAFENKKELDEYITLQIEAEKRDHRVLGKNLDLFIFSDLVGKGLPLYTEKGATIKRILEKYVIEEEIKKGYKHVSTPELARVELYKVSGHYPYYKDSMYPVMKIDEEELILRPMTCPHHYQLYSAKPRSYKELPYKIAELAKQFRYEKSGELTGLLRTRCFCLADAHIICQKEKAVDEINNVLDLIENSSKALGIEKGSDFRYRLSLGDKKDKEKYYKNDKDWIFAEAVLRKVLKARKSPFFEAEGEAAFYGPKIDIQMKNFAGKEETAFTVQYDFVGPKRFNLYYINEKGKKEEPIIIHRSSIGAIERTMAFLIEKYAGAFPVWLSPVQIAVIPISDKHKEYADKIAESFKSFDLRLQIMDENETLGKKIRDAEMQKIPYLLIVGDKEIKDDSISVRNRKRETKAMKLEKFIEEIQEEIKSHK